MAIAYDLLGDKKGLQDLIQNLPNIPSGTADNYLDIARAAEHLGLIDERNLILGAIAKADPSIAQRLVPLQNGSATSIDMSLQMTKNLVQTPPPTSVTSTQSTTSSGSGPRRR